MRNLQKILEILKRNRKEIWSYEIPQIWNRKNTNTKDSISNCNSIKVNPYEFYSNYINELILNAEEKDYLKPLGRKFNPKSSMMYCMLPRMFSCWNHYSENQYEMGTLLKSIALLSYLKEMGVNTLCLLPVFETSDLYKKGSLSSPYSVKNFFKVDSSLHDNLLGDYSEDSINIQFKAFVEACHILDISVVVDFVFRTVSRDCDLIIEHPDWFYWIDKKFSEGFSIPYINDLPPMSEVTNYNINRFYSNKETKELLKIFKDYPVLASEDIKDEDNILTFIEEKFGVTTIPGFSDVINDNQPLWTDVTYLKMYFDYHDEINSYIHSEQKPFILQDSVSLNRYPGKHKNEALWELITTIIPYYQINFGIDGARVDSAHVLPKELNKKIIYEARKNNPNFIFWSEEFNENYTCDTKKEGYDLYTGLLWSKFKYKSSKEFYEQLLPHVLNSEIPMLAALETPDTPRAWHIYKDMRNFEKMIMLSAFMPNSILFINNGMETKEIQPMNLGLENTEEGRYVLLHNHPFYGKLSFFDNYCLEWNNEDAYHIINVIKKAFSLKQDYASVFADKNFIPFENRDKLDVIALSYYDNINNEGISLLINCSVEKVNVSLEQLFNIKHLSIQKHKIECISACSKADAVSDLETWELNSLECSIIHILKSGKEN